MIPHSEYQYLGISLTQLAAQVNGAKHILENKVNNLQYPEDVLKILYTTMTTCTELVTFGRLILTILVSSVNAERSFATLK